MKSVAGAVRTYLAKYHKGSGMTAACVCVCVCAVKGAQDKFALKHVLSFLEEVGARGAQVPRSDPEPAIIDLMTACSNERARALPGAPTILEQGAVGNHQRAVEPAIQTIQAHSRTLCVSKCQIAMAGINAQGSDGIVMWMVPHSAWLISRFSMT